MKKNIGFFALALMALPFPASAGNSMNSTWFQCKVNTDCTVVQTACNKWEGVNKKYAQSFATTLPKWSSGAPGCPSAATMDLQKKYMRGRCVNSYCAAMLPRVSQ